MRALLAATLALFSVPLVGCEDEEVVECEGKQVDAATAVTSAQLKPRWDKVTTEDAVHSLPLEIEASIPCLIGAVIATVTTSRGQIGEVGPGVAVSVVLTPTEVGNDLGKVAGEFVLKLPVGRSARLDVRVGDWSSALLIERPDAGSEDAAGVGGDVSGDVGADVGAVDTPDAGTDDTRG